MKDQLVNEFVSAEPGNAGDLLFSSNNHLQKDDSKMTDNLTAEQKRELVAARNKELKAKFDAEVPPTSVDPETGEISERDSKTVVIELPEIGRAVEFLAKRDTGLFFAARILAAPGGEKLEFEKVYGKQAKSTLNLLDHLRNGTYTTVEPGLLLKRKNANLGYSSKVVGHVRCDYAGDLKIQGIEKLGKEIWNIGDLKIQYGRLYVSEVHEVVGFDENNPDADTEDVKHVRNTWHLLEGVAHLATGHKMTLYFGARHEWSNDGDKVTKSAQETVNSILSKRMDVLNASPEESKLIVKTLIGKQIGRVAWAKENQKNPQHVVTATTVTAVKEVEGKKVYTPASIDSLIGVQVRCKNRSGFTVFTGLLDGFQAQVAVDNGWTTEAL